ncbi:MAG: dipeptidyl aminopeptidase/acylaminoacyl peptidase [Rhodothermales bacterium]|jgi:dipeptidyl aminopeptidase/acylaminoacyl peptidase
MNLRSALCTAALVLFASTAIAQQKQALEHADYVRWKVISDEGLSDNGRWAVWREAPDTIGDGRVVVKRTHGDDRFVLSRGDDPRFASDYLVALVHPSYDSTRQAQVDGTKRDDLPKDSLAVLSLGSGDIAMYGPARSFQVPKEAGSYAAVLLDRETETTRDTTAAEAPHDKQDGRTLLLLDLDGGASYEYASVLDYLFSDDGKWLVYTAESKHGVADGVYAVRTSTGDSAPVAAGEGFYRQLALDDQGTQVAFVSNAGDFEADQPTFRLYRSMLGSADLAAVLAAADQAGIPDGWEISENGSLDFSDSGERLYFQTAPRPAAEVEDLRPDAEKVEMDIWSWTDKEIMTTQLVNRQRELRRSYSAVAHLATGTLVQLADENIQTVDNQRHGDGAAVFGTTDDRYMPEGSWDTPGWRDVYAIDTETGSRTLVLEGIRSGVTPSPDGTSLAWWDGEDLTWKITSWSANPRSVGTSAITPPPGVRFENELHDSPAIPGSNGAAGWSSDGRSFVFYDRYDIWAAQPNGRIRQLTSQGRKSGKRYRHVRLDPDVRTVDLTAPMVLSVFDTKDRSSGFARLELDGPGAKLEELTMAGVRFGTPNKAAKSDELMLTRESYSEFPNLWVTDDSFDDWTQLSDANPQQSEYLWGTAELVNWTSTDGDRLEGILYKPEGFDPGKKYPMMVYFYERSTDGLHAHQTPAPGRSVINRTFYASRGYLVFVPDIPYKIGYPGESAMNAVMPGVTGLMDRGFVDRDRIGVQGHSWGGYQIAYMVTRTNLFAAAEAGAPVANMFSAYGGIRWASGVSRAFQYERTQSRIGGTIWEKPLRYIENSPIFWLDKVETPLLILHNDHDGAVPWYQGIELFVGLRRLGKPAWLINYNGEPHWPLPYWKRVDWTTRMQQFFDHYLMDAPAPVWLEKGVPAVDKGRTWGLELPAGDTGN